MGRIMTPAGSARVAQARLQPLAPAGQGDVPVAPQLAAVQPRVERPLGGRRVGAAGDGLQAGAGLALGLERLVDGAGETEPGGLAAGREVVGAPGLAALLPALDQGGGGDGDVAGPGGRADLVVHHVQLFALLQQALHGEQEVAPVQGIDPAGAQDQVCAAHRADRLFPGQLAAAVDSQRVGLVVLGVGRGLAAIKDVVGGVVDQRRAQGSGLFGQHAGGSGIEGEGGLGLALGLVHGGVGGGVDDQVRALGTDPLADGLAVGKVEAVAAQDQQFALAGEGQGQFTGDLAAVAGDEDLHGNTSASAR